VLVSGEDWMPAGDSISWIACWNNRFKVQSPNLAEIPDVKMLAVLVLL